MIIERKQRLLTYGGNKVLTVPKSYLKNHINDFKNIIDSEKDYYIIADDILVYLPKQVYEKLTQEQLQVLRTAVNTANL